MLNAKSTLTAVEGIKKWAHVLDWNVRAQKKWLKMINVSISSLIQKHNEKERKIIFRLYSALSNASTPIITYHSTEWPARANRYRILKEFIQLYVFNYMDWETDVIRLCLPELRCASDVYILRSEECSRSYLLDDVNPSGSVEVS